MTDAETIIVLKSMIFKMMAAIADCPDEGAKDNISDVVGHIYNTTEWGMSKSLVHNDDPVAIVKQSDTISNAYERH